MSKKKLLNSVVALGTAAAMVLGGTFAWQSISQTAVNEASDIVNPGGRLHNDLAYIDAKNTDANIYVENFTDKETGDDIFARVRLSEYMEIVMNYGSDAAVVETVAGAKYEIGEGGTPGELADSVATKKGEYIYDYAIHYFGLGDEDLADGTENNKTYTYWTLNAGDENSSAVYMPTFNKNKDSLMADLNGLYDERVGGISNRGESQYSNGSADYKADDDTTAWAIYDADYNTIDELKDLTIDQLNQIIFGTDGDVDGGGENATSWNDDFAEAVNLVSEKHTAANVGTTNGLISMTEWLEKYEAAAKDENGKLTADGESAVYGYWVYDDSEGGNGWVYWSSPIKPGTTTGLLLDSFTLNQVMDDTWYYAIDVEGQFVTANDLGRGNKTGFYTTDDDQPTENAEKLLAAIGVTLDEKDDTPVLQIKNTNSTKEVVAYTAANSGDTFRVKYPSGKTPTADELTVGPHGGFGGDEWEQGTDYTYENGLLTLHPTNVTWLNEYGTAVQVGANDMNSDSGYGQVIYGDDGKLTLANTDVSDITFAPLNTGVTILVPDGKAVPENVELGFEYEGTEEQEGNYTYAAGVLTITNADWVGKVLKVSDPEYDGVGTGFVLVTAASTSNGDSSNGGGTD